MQRWRTPLLLLLVLSAAAVVRWARIDQSSLFLDEVWHEEVSTGRGLTHAELAENTLHRDVADPTGLQGAAPWWRIWANVNRVTHPPLYAIVLRWWREVFGESDVAARLSAAVPSIIAIALLFDVVRLLHNRAAAVWASLLMALAGAQIEVAQEVRQYGLMLALSMGALCAMVRIEKFGPNLRRNIALGGCVLGMALTHYFSIPAALALGAYALIRLRGSARKRAMAVLFTAGVVFLLAWGPFMLRQRSEFTGITDAWYREHGAGHVMRTFQRLGAVPLRLLIERPRGSFPLGYIAALLLIAPLLMLRRRPEMLIWCLWLGGTAFFIAALDLARSTQHLMYIRYAVLAGPAVYTTLAALVPRGVWQHVIGATVAIARICALPEAYRFEKPPMRELAGYLDKHIEPGDVVVFYATGADAWSAGSNWAGVAHASKTYPWAFVIMTRPPDADLLAQLRGQRAIWLVISGENADAGDVFPGAAIDRSQFYPYLGILQRLKLPPD